MAHPRLKPRPNPALRMTVGDAEYLVRFGSFTAIDSRDFRAATGGPLVTAIEAANANGGIDLDQIAGLAWLVARQTDPGLEYDDVAATVTYDAGLELAWVPDPDGSEDPEA